MHLPSIPIYLASGSLRYWLYSIFCKALAYALLIICTVFVFNSSVAIAGSFQQKGAAAIRYDLREDRPSRTQYRLRWFPHYQFTNENWSLHGFVVTGDDFSSNYNTLGSGEDRSLEFRHLYTRIKHNNGKTELGVIPPYKGRVSSTGLSKDGWITGLRHVHSWKKFGLMEWVIGSLDHLDEPSVFKRNRKINYLEMEFSSSEYKGFRYELAYEAMLEDHFIRGEIRKSLFNTTFSKNTTWAFEFVQNIEKSALKLIVSMEAELPSAIGDIDWFSYYTYVDEDFGERGELTEDFINFGHSVVTEGSIPIVHGLKGFTKVEIAEQQNRFQLGLEYKW
ncbi:hypothetical protein [Marinibactrum halimedae]|uniref:Uncharacterized protein n=1 Tax=Marinibactrum halimedae TaxID=1444977 RepID=A0AA37WQQ3_9GAMM|nr:hypothetical protein [Marinibactrum halimedae]MCD9458026.1 hypothetical protein [Marinibactrum halimedae]GLS27652.1 hypothetical protein GCM10007877_33710 [Marinibactrum halimedae]